MPVILGINGFHGDASAALVIDGQLVSAVEEERFNRIKHWAGFPEESIRWVISDADINPCDIDHIAVSFNPRSNLLRRSCFLLRHRPSLGAVLDRFRRQSKAFSLRDLFANTVGVHHKDLKAQFHSVEHHDAHIASGFLISPFDKAAILSVDGMGDFCSTVTAMGVNKKCHKIDKVFYPHSLGFLYNAVTIYLGFPNYGDEYKVMGLGPYGEPEFADFFRKIIYPKGDVFELNLDYFTHHKLGINMQWNNGSPVVENFLSQKFSKELGAPREPHTELSVRHENIAKSVQVVTEEIISHLLKKLFLKTKSENLCLTGGVAMNSVANGKIASKTPFKNIYIPAGAADNGTSFGAAFYVHNNILGLQRDFKQTHAYLGCHFSDEECAEAIRATGLEYVVMNEDDLIVQTVDMIIEGKVVGWFQGRMEFGARALGNRSLLADPRIADIRDVINLRIKFREKFRPFAPSVLEEYACDWFENFEHTPFMERVLPIKKSKLHKVPGIAHIDNSGRLQTVSAQTNPTYHALISRFHELTGIPMILNTSLNENEPIVRTPNEAVACFQRTGMDAIVLGKCVVRR